MDKYGLIGYPLTHSFSRDYFNEKFENEGIDATYINYEILSVEELPEIVHTTLELRGLNVTIPYKEQVMPLLDSISPEAEAVGAVNVIKVIRDKDNVILRGYNSDVIGFIKSLEPLLEPHHRKALVLGTGGAGKAVFYGLRQLGLEACYVSRTKKPGCLTYEEVTPAMMKEYNVIVNCTPMGMLPNVGTYPPLPYEAMDSHTLLYDLVYNPEQTLFLKKGEARLATTKNGLEMLLLQAFAAWDIWNGQV